MTARFTTNPTAPEYLDDQGRLHHQVDLESVVKAFQARAIELMAPLDGHQVYSLALSTTQAQARPILEAALEAAMTEFDSVTLHILELAQQVIEDE